MIMDCFVFSDIDLFSRSECSYIDPILSKHSLNIRYIISHRAVLLPDCHLEDNGTDTRVE